MCCNASITKSITQTHIHTGFTWNTRKKPWISYSHWVSSSFHSMTRTIRNFRPLFVFHSMVAHNFSVFCLYFLLFHPHDCLLCTKLICICIWIEGTKNAYNIEIRSEKRPRNSNKLISDVMTTLSLSKNRRNRAKKYLSKSINKWLERFCCGCIMNFVYVYCVSSVVMRSSQLTSWNCQSKHRLDNIAVLIVNCKNYCSPFYFSISSLGVCLCVRPYVSAPLTNVPTFHLAQALSYYRLRCSFAYFFPFIRLFFFFGVASRGI